MAYSRFSEVKQVTIYSEAWYGVQGFEDEGPSLVRIGNDDSLHADLPIQSLMKGCLINDDGSVNYYLKPTDWSKKMDESSSSLDGTDGQVMIEIPEFWYNDWNDLNVKRIGISIEEISGWHHSPKFYIGAYEACLNRVNNKLSSLKNNSADYRGGNNNSAWDLLDQTLLGKCVGTIPMDDPLNGGNDFHTYANNRGEYWYMNTLKARNAIVRLYLVEYANRNAQIAVNNNLTTEGYKQGGIGIGVCDANRNELQEFFGSLNYEPFVPIGQSDSLGNGSGEVNYQVPTTNPFNVKVGRYRGIENFFGHLFELLDGVVAYTNEETGNVEYYIFDNIGDFKYGSIQGARFAGSLPLGTSKCLKSVTNIDMMPLEYIDVSTENLGKYHSCQFVGGNVHPSSHYNHWRHGGYGGELGAYETGSSRHQGLLFSKSDDYQGLAISYCGTRLTCYPNGY